jgi:urea transport system substrate-binding protein
VVWETEAEVPGDAWSDYLPESRQLVADWRPPLRCGNYDREAGRCLAGGS